MMLSVRTYLHRYLLGLVLVGNTLVFAGVDTLTRAVTAALVVALIIDLRRTPEVPRLHRVAAWCLAVLVVVQLVPLPHGLRLLLQPGLGEVMHGGWAPLSIAPWATLQSAASVTLAGGLALIAARMAGTRSGLPVLLYILAACGALLAITGLVSEAGAPEKVLLIRANTPGGGTYGPFINSNHFAQGIELTVPAALVLLAAAGRQMKRSGEARRQGTVLLMAAAATTMMCFASILRSGSRGGPLFLIVAVVLTLAMWRRPHAGRRWPWLVVAGVVLVGTAVLASTRFSELEEGFKQLISIEGVDGNTRWELWSGTAELWQRAPLVGAGLGSYRHAIGLDKPATGGMVLEQAHNDWLEWLACTGVAGAVVLGIALVGLVLPILPWKIRRLRFEYRYPLAGAALALVATGLHELVGFGLQIPLNRYLLAVWIGLVWGVLSTTASSSRRRGRKQASGEPVDAPEEHPHPDEVEPTHIPDVVVERGKHEARVAVGPWSDDSSQRV